MGSTPTGAAWCLKALHPSDPAAEIDGIPDLNSTASVTMNYQSIHTLSAQSGLEGTWGFNTTLLPHPIDLMAVEYFDTNHTQGDNGIYSMFLNNQIDADPEFTGGGVSTYKYETLLKMAQQWRLMYMSVTAYQDGPDLANQGTIVCAQPSVRPRSSNVAWVATNGWGFPRVTCYTPEDYPLFETLQAMPNAYFGESKAGCYAPMKLTHACEGWKSETDSVAVGKLVQSVGAPGAFICSGVDHAREQYPHYLVTPVLLTATGSTVTATAGGRTSAMLNDTFVHLCARNLAPTTSFTFVIRLGIELRVHPGSILSPQLKYPIPYDPVALQTYYAVSRELKDAYPADYNDLGKLWKDISPIVQKVAGVVSGVPALRLPAQAVSAAFQVGDAVASLSKRKPRRRRVAPSQGVAPRAPPLPPRESGRRVASSRRRSDGRQS